MNRRTEQRAEDENPQALLQKHHRVLLHALHTAHQVEYEGKPYYIKAVSFNSYAGGVTAMVWLSHVPLHITIEDVWKLKLWKEPE